jgi:Mn-dependent DtxR family transcriptional regulator
MKMTELERLVANRLRHRQDPWAGRHGVGSRTVSGALGRLHRKGLVSYAATDKGAEWVLTEDGRRALDALI